MRFVAEILDGLKVQEAIDCLRLSIRIRVVHGAPEPHAPVGENERERDVGADSQEGDGRKAPVEHAPKDGGDQQHLQQGRHDVEHRQPQHALDPAGAAFDRAGQPARLPVQVEAERQAMQVLERLQRDLAHRRLLNGCKHRIAQLTKPGRCNP